MESDIVERLRIVRAFLDGSGPLKGYHFGDKPPDERGAFWWRKHLPNDEAADNITALRAEVAELHTWLEGRDTFIVDKGLWSDFVDMVRHPDEVELHHQRRAIIRQRLAHAESEADNQHD